jgi:predicted PurR-regulated permease PerM
LKRRFKWDKKYLYWGITAFLVIVSCIVFFLLLSDWSVVWNFIKKVIGALAPVTYGLVIAYLLNKVMTFFEARFLNRLGEKMFPKNKEKARRATRVLGILLTMFLALAIVGGTLALVIPQILESIKNLALRIPAYYEVAIGWTEKFLADNPDLEKIVADIFGNITESLSNWLETGLLGQAEQIITNITSGVFSVVMEILNVIIGVIVSVYILYHKEKFSAQSKKLIYGAFKPQRANKLLDNMRFLDKTLGGFVSGKLIDSLIVGVVCYIVLILFKIPYALLISVLIGITNIIPFFGPFIGAVPSALIILLEDPVKCLIFVIFMVILQQVDGNIIYPKIQGNTIGLSGFWVLFSILLFGGLLGFFGLLFGVPIFAVIYAAIRSYNTTQLVDKNYPVDTKEYEEIEYIDAETAEPVYKTGKTAHHEKNEGKPAETNETEDNGDDTENH